MTFQCISCGNCCSHIRGRISDKDIKFLEEYAYGKMPLIQLHPVEKISFPLWDWEVKKLDIEKGNIKPSKAIFDLNTNTSIIVNYFMDSDSCNFLNDNRCLIYDNRPNICKFFPFNTGPFSKENIKKENLFGICPGLDKIYNEITDEIENMIKFFHENFKNEFLNMVQHDIIMEWNNRSMVDLVKEKKIRAAINYPYDFLLKRINNSPKINFTNFLVEIGEFSREKMDNLIIRLDNNIDANEKIEEYLKN